MDAVNPDTTSSLATPHEALPGWAVAAVAVTAPKYRLVLHGTVMSIESPDRGAWLGVIVIAPPVALVAVDGM